MFIEDQQLQCGQPVSENLPLICVIECLPSKQDRSINATKVKIVEDVNKGENLKLNFLVNCAHSIV